LDGDERAGWKTATACCLHCLDEQTAAVEAREWQQIEQAHGDCKGNAERKTAAHGPAFGGANVVTEPHDAKWS
jgi:hypothetical protein